MIKELSSDDPLGELPAEDVPVNLVREDQHYDDPEYDTWHDHIDPESRGFAWSGPEGPELPESGEE